MIHILEIKMSKESKELLVTLYTENCECIVIREPKVLRINGITKNVEYRKDFKNELVCSEYFYTNDVYLEILPIDILARYSCVYNSEDDLPTNNEMICRLQGNDITQIKVAYGKKETIYHLKWEKDMLYNTSRQNTVHDCGLNRVFFTHNKQNGKKKDD